jgi:hypothetical protein
MDFPSWSRDCRITNAVPVRLIRKDDHMAPGTIEQAGSVLQSSEHVFASVTAA